MNTQKKVFGSSQVFDCINSFSKLLRRALRGQNEKGFTLIELIVVSGILGVLVTLAIPSYAYIKTRVKVATTASELSGLQTEIIAYNLENGTFPNSLNDVNTGILLDPYGRPYQYLRIDTNPGLERENGFGAALNSDFDVYSLGVDGLSSQAVDDPDSLDDIVRGSDGGFFGLGMNF